MAATTPPTSLVRVEFAAGLRAVTTGGSEWDVVDKPVE
jgi:hypothetical protein